VDVAVDVAGRDQQKENKRWMGRRQATRQEGIRNVLLL